MGQHSKTSKFEKLGVTSAGRVNDRVLSDSNVATGATMEGLYGRFTGWSKSSSATDYVVYRKPGNRELKRELHPPKPKLSELLWKPMTPSVMTEGWTHRPNSTDGVLHEVPRKMSDEADNRPLSCACVHEGSAEDFLYSLGKCGHTEVLPTITETPIDRSSSFGSVEVPISDVRDHKILRSPSPQPYCQNDEDTVTTQQMYIRQKPFLYINDAPYTPESRLVNRISASEARMRIRRQSQPNYNCQQAPPTHVNQAPSLLPPLQPNNRKMTIIQRETNFSLGKDKAFPSRLKKNLKKSDGKCASQKKQTASPQKRGLRSQNKQCFTCYTDWITREIFKRKIEEKSNRVEMTNLRSLLKKRVKCTSVPTDKFVPSVKKKGSTCTKGKLKRKEEFKGLAPWLNPRLSETVLWPLDNSQPLPSPKCGFLEEPMASAYVGHVVNRLRFPKQADPATVYRLPGLKSSPSHRDQHSRRGEQGGKKVATPRSASKV